MHAARIDYTNHRGERRWRHIAPIEFFYGVTPWYPEPGWMLHAMDLETNQQKSFALDKVHAWTDDPPGSASPAPVHNPDSSRRIGE